MPTDRILDSIKAEVKTIETRLGTLEGQNLGGHLEKLQEAHHETAVKLSGLLGAARVINIAFTVMAIVFALLSFLGFWNWLGYRQSEAVRAEAYEVLVSDFEIKIADTVDRISFIDPSDEQVYKKAEMVRMQEHLKSLNLNSPRFQVRSDLADAIVAVVDDKRSEADSRLRVLQWKTINTDPFVEARVLTLQAILLAREERNCAKPDVRLKVDAALAKDRGVAATYNVLGLCLTDKADVKLGESDQENVKILWEGLKNLQDGLGYYDLAFALKPTDWTKTRNLNNKVSAYLVFLKTALGKNMLEKVLTWTEYQTFDEFVSVSRRELSLCQQLGPKQGAYWETEAELDGLRWLYFKSKDKLEAAGQAYFDEKGKFQEAIKLGLFRKQPNYEAAYNYFCGNPGDPLLKNLCQDQEILDSIRKAVPPG